jgi:agmatinase
MNFLEKYFSYEEAKYIIVPVPLERTVSYGCGTINGPSAILKASQQLEEFDYELETAPYKEKIHVTDFFNTKIDINAFNSSLEEKIAKIIKDEKIPIVLGGEHSISYPVFKGIFKNKSDFSILHFDAHLDLRNAYNDDLYSHASVLRRIKEDNFNNIISFGIRSVSLEEYDYLKINPHKVYYPNEELMPIDIDNIIKNTKENLYITFDVDCFDPSIIPSTGTPEPGGYLWYKTLKLLRKLLENKNLIALDIVELAPDNINHYSEFTIAKLIYKIIGYGKKV